MKTAGQQLDVSNTMQDASTIKHSIIGNVVDGKSKSNEFIVCTTNGKSDWITRDKYIELNTLFKGKNKDQEILEYPLKSTRKGNEDEGHKAVLGKALSICIDNDNIVIKIYTQEHGQSWNFSNQHILEKVLYDAYALVFRNTKDVLEAEKALKEPVNFSLNLAS